MGRALVGVHLRHIQAGAIQLLDLGVGDRAVQQLFNHRRGALGRIHEDRQRVIDLLAADQIHNDLRLAGSYADVLGSRAGALIGIGLARRGLLFNTSCHIFSLLPLLAG